MLKSCKILEIFTFLKMLTLNYKKTSSVYDCTVEDVE